MVPRRRLQVRYMQNVRSQVSFDPVSAPWVRKTLPWQLHIFGLRVFVAGRGFQKGRQLLLPDSFLQPLWRRVWGDRPIRYKPICILLQLPERFSPLLLHSSKAESQGPVTVFPPYLKLFRALVCFRIHNHISCENVVSCRRGLAESHCNALLLPLSMRFPKAGLKGNAVLPPALGMPGYVEEMRRLIFLLQDAHATDSSPKYSWRASGGDMQLCLLPSRATIFPVKQRQASKCIYSVTAEDSDLEPLSKRLRKLSRTTKAEISTFDIDSCPSVSANSSFFRKVNHKTSIPWI